METMAREGSPRVTLGIATFNRDTYLGEAVASCLAQDYASLEVLVVLDGTTNPRSEEVLAGFAGDARLRVVRHETNRGIAAAYNTFVSEGRGELIAMLGDDDLCLPGRVRREVELFDRFPDADIVHGKATIIDGRGATVGAWNTVDVSSGRLLQMLWRRQNHIVDPTRMVHRRVYEAIGGYDDRFPLANDFDFWLRAAEACRFVADLGAPLTAVRRHDANTSASTARAREIDDVERALEASLGRLGLRRVVPELDWPVIDPADAERQALERLADLMDARELPLPGLAGRLRERARRVVTPARPRRNPAPGRRLLMTSFGFGDSGGGTTVPRLAAKELVRRGWEVTVFHAATAPTTAGAPYEVRETDCDGVRLVGVHNRAHGLFDIGRPDRELDDPPITLAFRGLLEQLRPDVVHFHNLHNLGAALFDEVAARGIPAHFTTHNYWLICPRAYLLDHTGAICAGPGDGSRCASCTGSTDLAGHTRRLAEIRARAVRGLSTVFAVSEAVKRTLVGAGYPEELVDVVRQAMPHETEIWESVGRDRLPGRLRQELTVGFLGSALPHKGPQLLAQAAQLTRAPVRVRIFGEIPPAFAQSLARIDRRGVLRIEGGFEPSQIGGLLADVDVAVLPSQWWDCAPLAAAECLAARTPLLVPRLGGLPESIREGVDGLSFQGLDVTDLARVLDRLADEPGLLERLQAQIEPPRAFADYLDELEAYYTGGRPARRPRSTEAAPAPLAPAVRWKGDHGLPTSLSIINDRVTDRLPFPLQRIGIDGVPAGPPLPHAAEVEVRHQWPPDLSPAPSGRLAIIQPWEFGAIPAEWLPALQSSVDELWVPSEYVRGMYTAAGVDPDRVVVIPNGVDLETFTPAGPRRAIAEAEGRTAVLFVGGLIWRKGADLLLEAWKRTFAGRDDVVLILKDFGADGVYRTADREPFREHAASGALPRMIILDEKLAVEELAALYRACDVLVHPYRGEGFAMPVLEAMACGLPVVVTAGGPTDEFCPPGAGWRVSASRREFSEERVHTLDTRGRPWLLEPSLDDLGAQLRAAVDAAPAERGERGRTGREAAEHFSWDAVAARYRERIERLATRPIRRAQGACEPFPLSEEVALRVLATPAWCGEDRLGELLADWASATSRATSACLYLLADTAVDGPPEALEARVLGAAAAAGVDLEEVADINVLMEPARADRDPRLHAAVDAYVPLHAACSGHTRMAREAGSRLLSPGDGSLAAWLREATPAPSLV